ncbi:DUF11 domain-containing protein [Actinomadura logoneensis]|uniref:DUF11 domain-containing protein n=1 Tax=Actinomadura logoneensis TaxID=2293572 RepID=A0A372JHX8_9ACTN|nr:DUF11 domain-containing protein [Actinomadura logoneensis]
MVAAALCGVLITASASPASGRARPDAPVGHAQGAAERTAPTGPASPDGPGAPLQSRAEPSIQLTKTASPTTFDAVNQTITYRYHVTIPFEAAETRNTAFEDFHITDDLPGLSAIDCPSMILAPGVSFDCTATYRTTQTDLDSGSIYNVATAQFTVPGASAPTVSNRAEATVLADTNAAITLRKSADVSAFNGPNQAIHYSYTLTNTGNVTLYNISVTDALPGISPVTCDAAELAPGESTVCHATYVTTQADVDAGSIRNVARALAYPRGSTELVVSAPGEHTIPANVNAALTLRKTPDPMTYNRVGQTITYTYTVTNNGNVTLTNVGVTDDLPGLSPITCDTTTLAPGESTECRATYQITQDDLEAGSVRNRAVAHGTPPAGAGGVNGGATPIQSPPAEAVITAMFNPAIHLEKSADLESFSVPGQTINYTYTLTNIGDVPLTDIGISDDLPGLSPITCDATSLAVGASTRCHALYVTTQADVDAGAVHNTAVAKATPPVGEAIQSEPSEVTVPAELNPSTTLQKTADVTQFTGPYETINYTYTVTNNGNVTLTNVGITDDLPGLSPIFCDTTILPPGESTKCHATYTTTQQDVNNGEIRNRATAHGTPPGAGTPIESPADEVVITGIAKPALTVEKSAWPTSFDSAYQPIFYTYRVTNTGNVTLTDVGVNDDRNLPVYCPQTVLDPGQSVDCQAVYITTQQDVDNGSITNSATAHGTPPGGGGPIESQPDQETILANAAPAITVEKSAEPMTYSAANQIIAYSYLVTNTGNVTLQAIGITDGLAGLSPIVCDSGVLAPGESTVCRATYVTTQQDVVNGSITNSATAHGTPPGSGTPVESLPSDVTVTAATNPALTMTKSADPMTYSSVDQTITFTYQVTNSGDTPLTNVGITDDLPGLSAVTCDTSPLDPGEGTTCRATYRVTQEDLDAGSVSNTATAHGTPPDGTTVESQPDGVTVTAETDAAMTVEKSAEPTTFSSANQTITYTYRVTNTGNVTLNDVGITDDLTGLSNITCETTTLAPGERTTCHATYTTTEQDLRNGQVHNTATAHGTPEGGQPVESGPSEATVTATPTPAAEIAVEKSAEPAAFSAADERITYTYRVTNTGEATLHDVGVTDDLAGLSNITCEATTLAAGQSTTCSATYTTTQADVDRGGVRNVATAHGTPEGGEPVESPSSEVTVPFRPGEQAGMSVRKSAEPRTFSRAGQEIRYSYRVTNTGTVPLTDIGVTDRMSGLSEVTCPSAELAPGESMTCTATYTTTEEDVRRGSIRNSATVHGRTPHGEPVESPPSTSTVHRSGKAGITVRKSVRPKTFSHVGQVLHFSYRVTNTGTVTLRDVRVEDALPGLSAVRCPTRTLAPRESMTCTAAYRVRAGDLRRGAVRNRAVAEGTPPGSRVPVASRPARVTAYGHVPVTG